ncbi:hypothetical protein QQF64_023471 [Cirrhinus molitorella]|uniref:Uncharacterized protein n=1 Tax=Cirrhinus molitorella TaxID=172907 RepID=A0ABR3L6T9_9TELE
MELVEEECHPEHSNGNHPPRLGFFGEVTCRNNGAQVNGSHRAEFISQNAKPSSRGHARPFWLGGFESRGSIHLGNNRRRLEVSDLDTLMPVRSISDSADKSLRVSRRLPIENENPPPSRNLQTRGQLSLLTFVNEDAKTSTSLSTTFNWLHSGQREGFLSFHFSPAVLVNE